MSGNEIQKFNYIIRIIIKTKDMVFHWTTFPDIRKQNMQFSIFDELLGVWKSVEHNLECFIYLLSQTSKLRRKQRIINYKNLC